MDRSLRAVWKHCAYEISKARTALTDAPAVSRNTKAILIRDCFIKKSGPFGWGMEDHTMYEIDREGIIHYRLIHGTSGDTEIISRYTWYDILDELETGYFIRPDGQLMFYAPKNAI